LAAASVVGVILPGASLVLGGPPPPGRRLLDAGARVAVATDCNPGTCFSESMPLMISLAVALAGLTPAEALVAATAGGAAALGLDLEVPVADGTMRRYVNLDYAASTPPMELVVEAITAILPWYSSVHRGAGFASQVSTRAYEAARTVVGRFVGARPSDAVI